MLTGPAVQDGWLLVGAYDDEGRRQRRLLFEAYNELRRFEPAWLRLVEPLRALTSDSTFDELVFQAATSGSEGTLYFDDLRLFGRLRVVPGARFEEVPEVAALGRDPLADGVDAGALGDALRRSRLPVKVRIMDQAVLAGVGNIYASEACFRAKLDPRRKGPSLSAAEVRRLAAAILAAMKDGIARQEGPEITYVEEGGENPFLVYGKEGERCPRCRRGTIRRVVQAQRSTFFCPRCQR